MEKGEYMRALGIFQELEDFSDSPQRAEEARAGMWYNMALGRIKKKDYAGAKKLLEKLGNFDNAQSLLLECGAHMAYEKAGELMKSGEYEEAAELLGKLEGALFPDAAQLLEECEKEPLYRQALASLQAEAYYDAYLAFTALGDYRDSREKAESCILEKPLTGEMYRSGEFHGEDCTLLVVSRGDGSNTFFKIYDSSETAEVSCIFIRDSETATVLLPAGGYVFKDAYGYGDWFGTSDLFGDAGFYERLLSGDSDEIFTLQAGHEYTLFLEVEDPTGGTPVETDFESREGF